MSTIKVDPALIVRKLLEGRSEEVIMAEFGLTKEHLSRFKRMLSERRLVAQQEADAPLDPPKPKKRSIDAKKFLASFRSIPDDFHLMQEFQLRPKQLKKVYHALISRGLLSEYEFNWRTAKAPELDEATENMRDSSTNVSLVESFSEETLRLFRSGGTGQALEQTPGSKAIAGRSSQPSGNVQPNPPLPQGHSESCPECGKLKVAHSPGVCVYCGIVFSKLGRSGKYAGVAIWDLDAR